MASIFHTSALLGICALVLLLSSSHTVHAGQPQHQLGWIPVGGEVEPELEMMNSRRILVGTIGYGALHRDTVPCSRRADGNKSSYHNCQGDSPANPYKRGCCHFTRCRGPG